MHLHDLQPITAAQRAALPPLEELSTHPYAQLLSPAPPEQFELLVESIRQDPEHVALTLCEGMLLDGQERRKACLVTGADPMFEAYVGSDPAGYLLRTNVFRRQLTQSQITMAALEAEAQAAAEQAKAEDRKHPGVPDDQAQRNFTDAESRIMPAPGGRDFLQAYNCQAVVDHARQVIVAARATSQSSDKQQAVGMIEEAISNTGAVPKEVSADAGYYSAKAVEGLSTLGVDPYVAPEQTRHGRVVPPAPRGRIPKHLSPRDRMRRKLQTRRGRQRYALRMETVEPVFGQIKQGRGFRQFLLRGLEKVQGEWSLICTGHNPESSSGQALLKLFRSGRLAPG